MAGGVVWLALGWYAGPQDSPFPAEQSRAEGWYVGNPWAPAVMAAMRGMENGMG